MFELFYLINVFARFADKTGTMGASEKPLIEIEIASQDTENKDISLNNEKKQPPKEDLTRTVTDVGDVQEMPTISTLLQRKKIGSLSSSKPEEATQMVGREHALAQPIPTNAAPEIMIAPVTSVSISHAGTELSRSAALVNEPPVFNKQLIVEALDVSEFEKSFEQHRGSVSMQKLDCLGFFSTRFFEVLLLSAEQDGFHGVLGFGNPNLVSSARLLVVDSNQHPALHALLSKGQFATQSSSNSFADELQTLNMSNLSSFAVVPVFSKKELLGCWVCLSKKTAEFDKKEIKTLTKIFSDFRLR